jgi:hypothetical protein
MSNNHLKKAEIISSKNSGYLTAQRFSLVITTEAGDKIHLIAKNVNTGAVNLSMAPVSRPVNSLPVPGDHIDPNSFSADFVVDELLNNYVELYNLMIDTVGNLEAPYCTLVLNIYTSHGNIARTITYHNCIISGLGELNLDSAVQESDGVVSNVTFEYAYMLIK